MGVTPTSGEANQESPAKQGMDELLARLKEASTLSPSDFGASSDRVATQTNTQAEILRATLKAQQEAEEMLAAAGMARREASEQAAEILSEAQKAADQLKEEAQQHLEKTRQKSADWATDQRATVESLVDELIESANREADIIRTDAVTKAMAEAEEASQRYLARAATRATQEADGVRDEAHQLLTRSHALIEETNASIHSMALTLSTVLDGLRDKVNSMGELLYESAGRDQARLDGSTSEEPPPQGGDLTEEGAPDNAAAADSDAPDEADPAEGPSTTKAGAPDAPEATAPTKGRPLGSLFRTDAD